MENTFPHSQLPTMGEALVLQPARAQVGARLGILLLLGLIDLVFLLIAVGCCGVWEIEPVDP